MYWNSFKYFIIIVLMSFFRFWIGPIGGKLNRFTSKVRSIHLHWCKIFLRKRIDTFGCVLLLQVGVSCWWMKLWIVECAWVLWWQRAGKDDRCTRWSNLSTIGTIRSSWSCANRLHVIIEFRHWCSWAGLTLSARSILRLQFTVRNGATWWFSIAFKVVLRFACLELRWTNDEWIQTIQFVVLGIKNIDSPQIPYHIPIHTMPRTVRQHFWANECQESIPRPNVRKNDQPVGMTSGKLGWEHNGALHQQFHDTGNR